ncbi:MAG: 1-acyl-sn-glycerol-3-phosphate acyltransferase [Salinivirgaceae bacterium]|nr:1-acyl-sn-glycerol-3-phosphate acyltransferase [Salinivirgaceae bacterium]
MTSNNTNKYSGKPWLLKLLNVLVKILYHPRAHFANSEIKNGLPMPCIIVSNHQSHVDGAMIGSFFGKQKIHYLAAKDRFEQSKMLGWLLRSCGCLAIDRKRLDTTWIHESLMLLNNKESICIFPEGAHGKNGEILPFHSGVSMLAFMARVPIVMVYIGKKANNKQIHIVFDAPFNIQLPPTGLNAETIDNETDKLRKRMLELQKQFNDSNV